MAEPKDMSIYVIGHKNPDTDAICSAIGYAHVLRHQGRDAVAARCGEVNARTVFALEEAGVAQPKLIMDVRPTAGQICHRDIIFADRDESLFEAFNRMRKKRLRSLPVIDKSRHMVGMLSILKMLEMLLPESGGAEARIVRSSLQRICLSVNGMFQHALEPEKEEEFIITVGAMSADAFMERLKGFPAEKVVLITGNRPTIQEPAIEYGVRGLVITGGYPLEERLLEKAREKGVNVIATQHDTASTTVLIKSAKRVLDALMDDAIYFSRQDPIELVRERVLHSSQVLFPVLNDQDELHGVFSKSDLLNPPLMELVLVDHNEFTQAVNGITSAKILEVVDHHRLGGGLSTREPIRFINEPLGSTSTIVARMCRDQKMALPPGIALCLATGIISDTLMLRSPTTTDVDREILPWLGEQAGRDIPSYAEAFFAAGSVLKVHSAEEAVRGDCKEYIEGDWKLSVAQIEELGLELFWERKRDLQEALSGMRVEKGVDFACLLVTDISRHYSILLTSGNKALCSLIDYPRIEEGVFELDGIVSRKKQLLPYLTVLFLKERRL